MLKFRCYHSNCIKYWVFSFYGINFDYGRHIINSICDRLNSDRTKVYFARLLYLIYAHLYPEFDLSNAAKLPIFQSTKRPFSDLISKDNKDAEKGKSEVSYYVSTICTTRC